ncbi:hypothetical protein EDB81DRAFT_650100 [Dactylonectria macrodidyma]|uniref:NAD(P)-binding protein n=1 Tax=Dactylonectria macrodidyma TaxID=307937 RepID=A0A9P9EYC7_9HYPO|nr:hypothetical protein EDB81DRAFT_650100 [Dactylonectria macrodidyma]
MSFSQKLLQGKVGLVTGAGSPHGIGRSLVLTLAAAGAKAVYATDLTLSNIASLQQEVKDSGSRCIVHGEVLDVTSEEQTISVLKKAVSTYGRFDFYFANAGVGNYRSLQDTDAAYYDRAISVMQRSFFLAIRYGGQAMSSTSAEKPHIGGSIVVTSSMAGVIGGVSDISYSTAKAAACNMVKAGAVQLSATHVRVNAIAPGFIKTSIAATSQVFDAVMGSQVTDSPYYYNRVPGPEEIANIGVFLVSDLSASINGQNIVADSGKTVAALGETVIGPIPAMKPF